MWLVQAQEHHSYMLDMPRQERRVCSPYAILLSQAWYDTEGRTYKTVLPGCLAQVSKKGCAFGFGSVLSGVLSGVLLNKLRFGGVEQAHW